MRISESPKRDDPRWWRWSKRFGDEIQARPPSAIPFSFAVTAAPIDPQWAPLHALLRAVTVGKSLRSTLRILDDAFARGQKVFVEGTQGTGLSLHHRDYPYVTSRDTSGSGCLAEAGIAPTRVRRTVIVVRTYTIRVQSPADGTSGPMGVEIKWNAVSRRSKVSLAELKKTEKTSTTKRDRRVAEFNWSLFRKAVSLNGPTDVALTFADYIDVANRKARRFEQLTAATLQFIEEVECVASAPVSLISTRFDHRSIIDRRGW
jgi:adenylosuccinate synthase